MQANFAYKTSAKDLVLHTGRISNIPEPGGKTRTIAIGDYWSQIALKPLHNILMKILRRMETDGTYDQGEQFKRIIREAKAPCFSFDLTSATDRFPIELQQHLVAALFGDRYGE